MSPRLPEFLAQVFPVARFAVTPYLPFGGVTFLYGKTRLGKSPLTWEMGRCVASGESFLGIYPVVKGRVLYCDLDTPPALVHARLSLVESPPEDFFIEFPGVRNILHEPTQAYFRRLKDEIQPIFVILNTLRKLYGGDEKDASLPSRIYATLMAIFAPAAILVVHHDKKSAGNPDDQSDPDEAFSGHMAWLNDCQVGLHLVRQGGSVPGLLRLIHAKSQVSAEEPPRVLQLAADGTHLIDYRAEQARQVILACQSLPETMTQTERVKVVAGLLKVSESTIWVILSRLPKPLPEPVEQAQAVHIR